MLFYYKKENEVNSMYMYAPRDCYEDTLSREPEGRISQWHIGSTYS